MPTAPSVLKRLMEWVHGYHRSVVSNGLEASTEPRRGPSGGITKIHIWLADTAYGYYEGTKYRPWYPFVKWMT